MSTQSLHHSLNRPRQVHQPDLPIGMHPPGPHGTAVAAAVPEQVVVTFDPVFGLLSKALLTTGCMPSSRRYAPGTSSNPVAFAVSLSSLFPPLCVFVT